MPLYCVQLLYWLLGWRTRVWVPQLLVKEAHAALHRPKAMICISIDPDYRTNAQALKRYKING